MKSDIMRSIAIVAVIFVVLALLGGVVFFLILNEIGEEFWTSMDNWKQEDVPWVECPVHEFGDGLKVAIHFQHAHPFLAEFYRKLVVTKPGGEIVEMELPMNTGGKTNIKVYGRVTADFKSIGFRDKYMHESFDLSVLPPTQADPSGMEFWGHIGADQKFVRAKQ